MTVGKHDGEWIDPGLLESSTVGYADSGRKQVAHSLGKEGRIRLIPVWVASKMAPYRWNWSEFGRR
jgi:hypothetical protein